MTRIEVSYAPGKRSAYAEAMFPAIAPRYDFLTRWLTFRWSDRWRRAALDEARLRPGARVLDIATGTGVFAFLLARAASPGGKVVGVDISDAMLEQARRRLRSSLPPESAGTRGLAPAQGAAALEFVRVDGETLPFDEASFDAATLSLALRYFDVPRVLSEMRRVLKPGGRAVIVEFGEPRGALLRAGYRAYAYWVMPGLGALFSGRRDVWKLLRFLPNSIHYHHSPEDLLALFREAGFRDASCRRLTLGIGLVFSATA